MSGFDAPLDLRAYVPDEWIVLAPFAYISRAGRRIVVPSGFVTDLASIPPLLRPIFDTADASRQPAVLHDWLYCSQQTGRAEADRLFREALACAGVGFVQRWAMYAGVRAAGWLYWSRRDGLEPDDFFETHQAAVPRHKD